MNVRWHFHRHDPGARVRDAIQGEFFASESIDGPGEALVREGIQNACDAAVTPNGTVRVRLYLSEDEHALPVDVMLRRYGAGIWEHLQTEGNGLKTPPTLDEPCRFLVFEDFGTTGLIGDVSQWQPTPGDKNPFFYFVRAEGLTDKRDGKGGSWGVGKTVFPRSSRANAFFGFTIRYDDEERLLFGSMTLKTHQLNGDCYDPDAWFGVKGAPGAVQGMVMPTSDDDLIRSFRRDFRLARSTEPGLSLVVPWYDPEITRDGLLVAVLRQWFFPILSGRLVVALDSPGGGIEINRHTLREHLAHCPVKVRDELAPLFTLAETWTRLTSSPIELLPQRNGAPKWTEESVPAEKRARIRQAIDSAEAVLVRVPVEVRRKKQLPESSFFDICLVRDDAVPSGKVTFVRNGIIIPEVRHSRARGIRALVVAEHGALAQLLRDAEHPAHTHWSRDTSNFREKYDYGPSFLSFVQNSVAELNRLLMSDEVEEDPELLADVFSLPWQDLDADEETPKRKQRRQEPSREHADSEPPPTPPTPKPTRFTVSKVAGGFRISRGNGPSATPAQLRVRVAYDRRSGNPFKRWVPADFVLNDGSTRVEGGYRGVSFERVEGNEMVVAITDPDFEFSVAGFDPKRDIIVDVRAAGEADDSAT